MKLNLGCGTSNVLQGWENIDGSYNAWLAQYPRVRWGLYRLGVLPEESYNIEWEKYIDDILVLDVRKGLPFRDESVEYIFSSHLIEHLSKQGAIELLQECKRVLKSEGVVRISTPNLQIIVDEYLEGKGDRNTENELPADRLMHRLGLPVEETRKNLLTRLFDITIFRMHDHKWLYDEQTLRKVFVEGGFEKDNIDRRSYQEGKLPDLTRLDNREDHSIYMEAIK